MAVGISALPAMMAHAAPEDTPAPTIPVVAQATDPVATAAPTQTENVVPNQPAEGNTLPAVPTGEQAIGQVMPGVQGANAPIVAQNTHRVT